MRKYLPHLFAACFVLIVFLFQLRFIQQPVIDNDEGIYTTTFILIDHGYPAYTKTFFSQPPAFLLSVYPGFLLFGKTLQAARLTIVLWSILGLVAVYMIGYELKNVWIGVLSMGLMYLTYFYSNQTHTFQSDALVNSFTLICFATLLRFKNTQKILWYILAVFFLNLSFWTKFNFFFIPSFLIIAWMMTKRAKLAGIFIFISGLFVIVLQLIFGLQNIFSMVLSVRLAAFQTTHFSLILITYILHDPYLTLIICASLILLLLRPKQLLQFPLLPIFLWAFLTFVFLFLYRPLFPHHLAILVTPFVLLFSLLMISIPKKYMFFYQLGSVIVLIVSCIILLYQMYHLPVYFLSPKQKKLITIIDHYTNSSDSILTDEEIVNSITNRLPSPQLSDVSFVRITSGSLPPNKFQEIINTERPKLIIPWNGRLAVLLMKANLDAYITLTVIDGNRIYIHK